jgi:hypothetical protein
MDTQRRFSVMGDNVFNILSKVMKNQRLLKLLKFTDNDPLKHPDLTQDEIDKMLHKNILIVPKIPDEPDEKLCYLIILLDRYQVAPNNSEFKTAEIRFVVLCPTDRWVINEKTLRPYAIMNEIDKMFNEKELAGIGNLKFDSFGILVPSVNLSGYTMIYGHYEFN